MKKRSKRYKDLIKFSTKGKKVDVKDILDLVKKTSTTKIDESVDVSMRKQKLLWVNRCLL